MNIIAIDDERLALNALVRSIREAEPGANVYAFQKPSELLAEVSSIKCDVAFLDIKMPGITGLELAKRIKMEYPKVNIIFVTGYNEYALEAMELRSSGYVMKPVTREKIEQELQALRYPVPVLEKKKLYIQCFGNFEVFYDGKPINFRYSKTKELLAYLIDRRGSNCTMGELMAVLWEERVESDSLKTQLRKLISDLRDKLKAIDEEEIIHKERNVIAVDTKSIDCDYYNYLNSPITNINLYRGEYMMQYSWAEYANAALMRDF